MELLNIPIFARPKHFTGVLELSFDNNSQKTFVENLKKLKTWKLEKSDLMILWTKKIQFRQHQQKISTFPVFFRKTLKMSHWTRRSYLWDQQFLSTFSLTEQNASHPAPWCRAFEIKIELTVSKKNTLSNLMCRTVLSSTRIIFCLVLLQNFCVRTTS